MTKCVLLEDRDGVIEVILNRPEKHNSLNMEMFEALVELGNSLLTNVSVRAVILRGEGPSFCAGLDLNLMRDVANPNQGTIDKFLSVDDDGLSLVQRSAYIWKLVPVPVICSIQGVAFGGGCQIALGADIRIVHPNSKMGIMESSYGLIPDLAITQTLPHLVAQDVALELTTTARIIDGTEAVGCGLATKESGNPLGMARKMARDIAGRSPDSVRAIKKLYSEVWQAGSKSGLSREREMQRALIGNPNQVEAVTSMLEKRTPRFSAPS